MFFNVYNSRHECLPDSFRLRSLYKCTHKAPTRPFRILGDYCNNDTPTGLNGKNKRILHIYIFFHGKQAPQYHTIFRREFSNITYLERIYFVRNSGAFRPFERCIDNNTSYLSDR